MLPEQCVPVEPVDSTAESAAPLELSDQVRTLLQQSRSFHAQKRSLTGRQQGGRIVTPPNYPQAEAAIREAIRTRAEAEQLDPEHTAPAWIEDLGANQGVSSHTLLTFFRHYLTIE